jgi:hypothetical protein
MVQSRNASCSNQSKRRTLRKSLDLRILHKRAVSRIKAHRAFAVAQGATPVTLLQPTIAAPLRPADCSSRRQCYTLQPSYSLKASDVLGAGFRTCFVQIKADSAAALAVELLSWRGETYINTKSTECALLSRSTGFTCFQVHPSSTETPVHSSSPVS